MKFRNIIFFCILTFGVTSGSVDALAQSIDFVPNVPLPGFEARPFEQCTDSTCTFPQMGEYIVALYRYGIGLAAALAVMMSMIGGFMWLTSAGSPDRVSRGKEYITAALTGLALALFSYLILYIINPRLVTLEGVSITAVPELPVSTSSGTGPSVNATVPARGGDGTSVELAIGAFPDSTGGASGLPVQGAVITGEYGDPRSGGRMHRGLDFAAPAGTDISAVSGGTVVQNGYQASGWGNYVTIDNGNGVMTRYAHLQSPSPFAVGASITRGQFIGDVGNTGGSEGDHLHFEVIVDDGNSSTDDRIDPRDFLGL